MDLKKKLIREMQFNFEYDESLSEFIVETLLRKLAEHDADVVLDEIERHYR